MTRKTSELIGCPEKIDQYQKAKALQRSFLERYVQLCEERGYPEPPTLVGDVFCRSEGRVSIIDISWFPETPTNRREELARDVVAAVLADWDSSEVIPIHLTPESMAHISLASAEYDHSALITAVSGQAPIALARVFTS